MRRPKGPSQLRSKMLRRNISGQWFAAWWRPYKGLGQWTHYPRHVAGECPVCDPWEKGEKMKIPEVKGSGAGGGAIARVEPPKLLSKLTAVCEVLVQPTWDGGELKGERALFVFVAGTLVKLLLKLESPPLKLLVSGRTWDEAWASLEATLRLEDVPWEQDTPRQNSPQKKRKGGA